MALGFSDFDMTAVSTSVRFYRTVFTVERTHFSALRWRIEDSKIFDYVM